MKKGFVFCSSIVFILYLLVSCQKKEISNEVSSVFFELFEKSKETSLSISDKKKHLNSALNTIDREQNDSLYLKMLHYKVHLLGLEKAYDSAQVFLRVLILGSQKTNDSVTLGKAYFIKGLFYKKQHKIDSAYFYYEKSKEVFTDLNDSIEVAKRLLNMSLIELDYGDYLQSDHSSIEALKYLNHKKAYYQASVYNTLAMSLRGQKEFKEALKYYDKAIELTSDRMSRNIFRHNKANIFRDLHKYDSAILILDKLNRDSIITTKDPRFKAQIISNLAYSKWLNDERKDVLKELLRALVIRSQEKDFSGLLVSYSHLSYYYQNVNIYKSIVYAKKRYVLAKSLHKATSKLEALMQLIAVDGTNATNKYYKEYISLSDSIQTASKKAKNQFANIRYHSEENKKLAILFKAKSIEKQLQFEKEKNKRNITIGVSLLLGMLSLLYIQRKLQKHKKEKILEIYKTEKRISEKIHDELSNDVFSLMNSIQFSEIETESILDDLEGIYKRTRNISHENSSIEVGVEFETSLIHMLSSFMHSNCKVMIKGLKAVEIEKLEAVKQIVVYRVLQELMVNMKKHSTASLVVLSFINKPNCIDINYADNGVGCDFKKIQHKSGLPNMETRMTSIGGTLIFDAKPSKGFKAAIHFKK